MSINTHPQAQWFGSAGLGLFLHWGICSVAGVEISWGMLRNKPWNPTNEGCITPDEYWKLAEQFNPGAYDPDRWLAATRQAGMTYAVLTTKHHDGYCLWPSQFGHFGVTQHLAGRDLIGPYVDACRRHGLRVGLYFSLEDWRHGFPLEPRDFPACMDFYKRKSVEPEDLPRFENYYRMVLNQLTELLTRYGRIDLLWFDGAMMCPGIHARMAEVYALARSIQPHIVINGRTWYTSLGDYVTPENHLPDAPPRGWWEICQIWHHPTWAYSPSSKFHDMDWLLERLARTRGMGGNLLISLGPMPTGELQPEAYDHLAALGDWMRTNSPSVMGVDRGPWPARSNLPITRRPGTWFVHVLGKHSGPIVLKDVPAPTCVQLLRNHKPITHRHAHASLTFDLSASQRVSGDEVIAITWPRQSKPVVHGDIPVGPAPEFDDGL